MRIVALLMILFAAPAWAEDVADMAPREGWRVMPTEKSFDELVEAVRVAARANQMGVVTQAGPTGAAANRGITIPGNRIIGVFNNDIAVRTLRISTAAMIEAPIRFYVTENADGTATVSWKEPSFVFAPYMAEAEGLAAIAAELDAKFEAIGTAAAE